MFNVKTLGAGLISTGITLTQTVSDPKVYWLAIIMIGLGPFLLAVKDKTVVTKEEEKE